MRRLALFLVMVGVLVLPRVSLAVPETMAVRVADVTPNSFSVVWLSSPNAVPSVEVYSDNGMSNEITAQTEVIIMPGVPAAVADEARSKGIFKVRVQGLEPLTTYYVRAVSTDPDDQFSRSLSQSLEVVTQHEAASYIRTSDGQTEAFSNDLAVFPVFTPLGSGGQTLGLGDVVLLDTPASPYPVSAFVGAGAPAPDGLVDLNNLFGQGGVSFVMDGIEKAVLTVYRGGVLSNLAHYRWLQENTGIMEVREPMKGFFADFNLDGAVDMQDFASFKERYRTAKSSGSYNPDFDFADDGAGVVDARDFSRFAEQYGRTGVPLQ